MPLRAVIFDLDLTLIASSEAEQLRRQRRWSEVYQLIPTLQPYEGVNVLIGALSTRGIKTAIVTSSPASYCNRVIGQWRWTVATTVCYHDTVEKKPHPAPIVRALSNLAVASSDAIAVGDHPNDIVSARGAGVFAVAALWGIPDPSALVKVRPDISCSTVAELAQFIEERTKG